MNAPEIKGTFSCVLIALGENSQSLYICAVLTRVPRICCLDLDTFFVSVERLLDPSLVGVPVVVGARPGQRGVVLASSYEVRAMGVRSGMSMTEAYRLAPDATFIPPRHDTYAPYAQRVKEVLERFTPAVQAASIDEFYLDFHGCEQLYAEPSDTGADATLVRVLHGIHRIIRDEIGLPASTGVGCTRAVAKVASGLAKPNKVLQVNDGRQLGSGVVLIPAGRERAWLGSLPLRRFPGIGPKAELRLRTLGLHTIEDVLSLEPGPLLDQVRGVRDRLRHAMDTETADLGRDRPAFQEHDPMGSTVGSISNECTFMADLADQDEVDQRLLSLVERVCWRARKRSVRARTITLKLRYRDFSTFQRSLTTHPTCEDAVVMAVVRALLARAWSRPAPIRLLGVALSNLSGPDRQLELPFPTIDTSPSQAIDRVRARFGFAAIRRGRAGRVER